MIDLNSHDFYLLEDKPSDKADCKILPAHITKLLKKYMQESLIDVQCQSDGFSMLHCNGTQRRNSYYQGKYHREVTSIMLVALLIAALIMVF